MKTCEKCKYAEWKRTTNGRLHPDKSGKCIKTVQIPQLPACQCWMSTPQPSYPYIERGCVFYDQCPYWEAKP